MVGIVEIVEIFGTALRKQRLEERSVRGGAFGHEQRAFQDLSGRAHQGGLHQSAVAVYQREFHEASRTQVIHAGLECGIIAAKYPGMDIVSFGPTIRGAHAPGESVEIESVTRTWDLLRAIVRAVATQGVGATLHTTDN